LKHFNFDVTTTKIDIDTLIDFGTLPSVLLFDNNHYVVLYKINRNEFYISDPEFGKYCPNKNPISKVIKNRDFTKYWNINPDKIEDIKDSELRYAIFPAYEINEINGKYYFKKD